MSLYMFKRFPDFGHKEHSEDNRDARSIYGTGIVEIAIRLLSHVVVS